jgi:hypothetical protein
MQDMGFYHVRVWASLAQLGMGEGVSLVSAQVSMVLLCLPILRKPGITRPWWWFWSESSCQDAKIS